MTRKKFPDRFRQTTDQRLALRSSMLEARMVRMKGLLQSGSIKCAIEPRMTYHPMNPWNSPFYYPQNPLPQYGTPAFYLRLSEDTLFFIFYYFPNTFQQQMAGRELMRLSWRYHKKHATWYKRHEEPVKVTETFEKGTYIYFDPEEWKKSVKSDFTFYYNQLLV
ncbi:CCR4-NOT transcription complex subunit 3 [Theileria orientalis]|uniref:CCR4-NOT transcription complex subunit 3 n=1 Tax=Theileria orientalis TaxID=68886 RepID=A0A976SJK6_THEOR|nr:CCR4-NOT transcription complex subunit 3 [Theileria orientalis]